MNFNAKIRKFWVSVFEKGAYKRIVTGLKNTVIIAVLGLLIGIVIGTLIAVIRVVPKTNKLVKALDKIAAVYVAFFRGTPMVAQLLIGYFVLLPLLNVKLSSLAVCVLIFGLNSGAYVSEIMRSGVLSVDIGQTEAGRAIGLGYGTTMRRIVLPQAFKNSLPALGNELIALTKDTSVASFIALVDLTQSFRLLASGTYEFIIPYLILALIYLVIVIAMTIIIKLIERRLRKSDRQH